MVHAVLAGRKTQTRRPMYPQPDRVDHDRFYRNDGREIVCPFGLPGDRLWVRERFAKTADGCIVYAADPVKRRSHFDWQQSRYLPREASRMTLRVLYTRPQQLQEISESDARAEGYDATHEKLSPIDWFARLWDRLTAIESLRWAANPWLWVVHFELIAAAAAQPPAEPNSLFDQIPDQAAKPVASRTHMPRVATIQEKRQLAERLRTPRDRGSD